MGPSTVTINNALSGDSTLKINGPLTGTTQLIGITFSTVSNADLIIDLNDTPLFISNCVFNPRTYLKSTQSTQALGSLPPTLTIDNCIFDKASFGITYSQAGSSCIFSNNEIKNLPNGFFGCESSSLSFDHITISDFYGHDCANSPMLAEARVSGSISNTTIEDIGCNGMTVQGANVSVSNLTIRRCGLGLDLIAPFTTVTTAVIEDCMKGAEMRGFSQTLSGVSFKSCQQSILAKSLAGSLVEDCRFEATVLNPGDPAILETGIFVESGELRVDRCRFQGLNDIYGDLLGGAAIAAQASITVTNSEFQDCRCASVGGAISVTQTSYDISNCSFVDNVAVLGASIRLNPAAQGQLRNCIFRGASSPQISGASFVGYCNVEGGWSGPGIGNFDSDPLFVDVANGDLHIASGSACIDAGDYDTTGLASLDFDGHPRVFGNYVDVGADESLTGVFALNGTGDDFFLIAKRNNARINGGTVNVQGGDIISVGISSPQGSLIGFPVYLLGELFPTGGSPILPAGHPAIHLNLSIADILFDPSISVALPGWAFGLPSSGLDLVGPVPFGFSGNSYRLQAFMLAPVTLNSWYAASNAHDLVHM